MKRKANKLTRPEISQLKALGRSFSFEYSIHNAKFGVFPITHRAYYYSVQNGHVKVKLV